MRAIEFIKENATAGATASGAVAVCVKPLEQDNDDSFFGGNQEASIYNKPKVTVIRRSNPTTENNKKG